MTMTWIYQFMCDGFCLNTENLINQSWNNTNLRRKCCNIHITKVYFKHDSRIIFSLETINRTEEQGRERERKSYGKNKQDLV